MIHYESWRVMATLAPLSLALSSSPRWPWTKAPLKGLFLSHFSSLSVCLITDAVFVTQGFHTVFPSSIKVKQLHSLIEISNATTSPGCAEACLTPDEKSHLLRLLQRVSMRNNWSPLTSNTLSLPFNSSYVE